MGFLQPQGMYVGRQMWQHSTAQHTDDMRSKEQPTLTESAQSQLPGCRGEDLK